MASYIKLIPNNAMSTILSADVTVTMFMSSQFQQLKTTQGLRHVHAMW